MTDAGPYFAMETPPGIEPASGGGYVELEGIRPIEFVAGLKFRSVVSEQMLVNFVRYEPHTVAPRHAHEEGQITFVIEGEFEFDLAGDMRPGTVVVIPPHVPHGARTLDASCFEIDVFCPPRKVLLQALEEWEAPGQNGEAAPASVGTPDV